MIPPLQPYNWKVPCAVEPLCYSFDQVTELLNVRCLLSCLPVDGRRIQY